MILTTHYVTDSIDYSFDSRQNMRMETVSNYLSDKSIAYSKKLNLNFRVTLRL